MSTNLELKVLWAKKFLGLSVNQVTKNKVVPLTVYYFWPKTEAWEQLKIELDSKPGITQGAKAEVLNLTSDIIKFWQKERDNKTFLSVSKEFKTLCFLEIRA